MTESPKEILDIMVAEANEGIKKFGNIDQGDRRKILNDGYMEIKLETSINTQDPRIRLLLFQYYEGMRAKLALAPTHISYEILDSNHVVFRYHVQKEGGDDIFKKAVMKLECSREGRIAELTKEERDIVMAFYIPNLNDKSGTWHNKPYTVKE